MPEMALCRGGRPGLNQCLCRLGLVLLLAGAVVGCERLRRPEADGAALASSQPPAGLAPRQVPLFVCFGTDDNGYSGLEGSGAGGGMHFVTELFAGRRNPLGTGNPATFDGSPAHFSFFVNTHFLMPGEGIAAYGEVGREHPVWVKRAWSEALAAGHEMGVHTHSHPHGREFTAAQWEEEIQQCVDILTSPHVEGESPDSPGRVSGMGIPREELLGFRTPFLEYSDETLVAARRMGFAYDCTLEEGTQYGHDGTNFFWPYPLDRGSPCDSAIGQHPGLWEIPVYVFIVPPDEECERFGVAPGLRADLHERKAYFDPGGGKISGMDWNLWCEFRMTPAEFLATIKYSLEQRLAGNRCPITIGLHSQMYSDWEEPGECDGATIAERRAAVVELFDYVLQHEEVRVVSARELLTWLQVPVPLAP